MSYLNEEELLLIAEDLGFEFCENLLEDSLDEDMFLALCEEDLDGLCEELALVEFEQDVDLLEALEEGILRRLGRAVGGAVRKAFHSARRRVKAAVGRGVIKAKAAAGKPFRKIGAKLMKVGAKSAQRGKQLQQVGQRREARVQGQAIAKGRRLRPAPGPQAPVAGAAKRLKAARAAAAAPAKKKRTKVQRTTPKQVKAAKKATAKAKAPTAKARKQPAAMKVKKGGGAKKKSSAEAAAVQKAMNKIRGRFVPKLA